MSGSVLLRIEGLRKRYGERMILDVPALALESGVSYVLTGANGSGKSTLLRILAGLEPAAADSVRFDGRTALLERYPPWLRREIVYVHDHPYLFDTSIEHNIVYGLKAHGVEPELCRKLAQEAIDWAGVRHLLDVPPRKLSGGEKQRVALARVKVLNPRLYLLDEPTANLDDEARARTLDLIQHLCSRDNCVLIACHDREVIRLPNMIRLHIAAGRITRPGTDGATVAKLPGVRHA